MHVYKFIVKFNKKGKPLKTTLDVISVVYEKDIHCYF